MCGIAGIFDTAGRRPIDAALVRRMNAALRHRGPDEDDVFTEAGVALGHTRLSVIDLQNGRQPMANEDGSVLVTYNGEIYNFRELATELAHCGHVLRTRCDTEVIVHAWEEWGVRCVERFRGMFAFAVFDRRRGTLFLARDRLGVKPLYYTFTDDGLLCFASELKALRCLPGFSCAVDPTAVEDYFALGYVPDPKTIYHAARKLAPGWTLLQRIGAPRAVPVQYWDLPFVPAPPLSLTEACAELVARLREAVRVRLVADVPLGAFLSGGVDSSAVVAMMAGLGNEPVETCSIGFPDPRYDESRFAGEVASLYRTRHHTRQVDPDDTGLVDLLAALYDEPFADSSALPTYRVCQLARERVTVALSGDGGDEHLAGYRRYRLAVAEDSVRRRIPAAWRGAMFGMLGRAYPKADWAPRFLRAKTTFQGLARDLVDAYHRGVSLLSPELRARLFSPSMRSALQGYSALATFRGHAVRAPADDPLALLQYLDLKTYLPGDILTKVDRASMAHALEVRGPLLDHKLVEWIASLPSAFKLRRGEGKFVFKRSLERYLPASILYRRKQGFSVPLEAWFRGPLREQVRETLCGDRLADTGYFDRAVLSELVEQHQAGRRDYSSPIWALLMFDAFLRLQEEE
ncbi:MAG TPA: XrtA/PEP-CTERM system amidotransferase [Telluria sp.]|nr:XrtA/PEP-CTERM system amidotransferase [Telluria sp.]